MKKFTMEMTINGPHKVYTEEKDVQNVVSEVETSAEEVISEDEADAQDTLLKTENESEKEEVVPKAEEPVVYEAFGTSSLKNVCTTYYARKKGRSHVETNKVCQDYCLAENIDARTQVVCVADGHGGAAYTKSDAGSRIACTLFRDMIIKIKSNGSRENINDSWITVLNTANFKNAFIQCWRNAVLEDYKKTEADAEESDSAIIKKYGTTFLFAVYDESGIALGQLGDGAILLADNDSHWQLFKRHDVKLSSATSSLASGRAEYAFVTDIYSCNRFPQILLSTDGIYDKLDNDDAFYIYEQNLITQVQTKGELLYPFSVNEMDVSYISKDDCTIALLLAEKETYFPDLTKLKESGYIDITFERSLNGLDIFKACKDDENYEIRIVNGDSQKTDEDFETVEIVKPIEIIDMGMGKIAYIYAIPKDCVCIAKLIECGEHLEKRYFFNDVLSILLGDEIKNANSQSNNYWLSIYEKMRLLEEELDRLKCGVREFLLESTYITEEQTLLILEDALYQSLDDPDNKHVLAKFFNAFSIVGKLVCGEIVIPLFETRTQGQSIMMLHALPEKKELCRVIYNKEKQIVGLWNASDRVWNVENEKRNEIAPRGVLRLNRNHTFCINSEDDVNADEAEIIDGCAKYQVIILRR